MKQLLVLFLVFSTTLFAQTDWKNLTPPDNVINYNSTNFKYHVDDAGRINCIYTFYDGTDYVLQVDQYDSDNVYWFNKHYEVLPAIPDTIKIDRTVNDALYFTFISDQSNTPTINMYALESNSVYLLFRKVFTAYQSYTKYDFKAIQADEYFWFFSNVNFENSLAVWNPLLVDVDVYDIPQFSGSTLNNFQLQTVGDTLWMAGGDQSSNFLQLIKTHKSNINFLTHDGGLDGMLYTSLADNIISNQSTLLSDRVNYLTVYGKDFTNNVAQIQFTNGFRSDMFNLGFFPNMSSTTEQASGFGTAYMFSEFGTDPSYTTKKIMVQKNDYSMSTWEAVGPSTTEIFEVNISNSSNFSLAVNENANRVAAAYDVFFSSDKRLKILNTIPNVDSLIIVAENTLCPNTLSMNLFSSFSIYDENGDPLRIVGASSSVPTVLATSDIAYYSSFQSDKRQHFVVDVINTSAGTTTLSFVITDGFDTITITKDVTFAGYTIASVTDGSHCGDGQPMLDATTSNGFGTLYWYDSPSGGSLVASGSPFYTPFITSSTVYYVEAHDNNCLSNRLSVNAIIYPLPVVDAGIDQTICEGDAVTLSASGAITYVWDNGVSDGTAFNPTFDQTYTVTGTDGNGCESTDQVSVFVNSLPVVDAGFDQIICDGTSITLSGNGASTLIWDNSVVDATPFTPSVGTITYTLTGIDGNGCQNIDQVDVTVNALPSANVTIAGSLVFCQGQSVDLTADATAIYFWNDGNTTQTVTILASGTYNVTVTDANGCSAVSSDILVTVNNLPIVDAGVDLTVCEGSAVTLTGSGATTLNWDNSVIDGSPFIPALGTITYTLTGIDGNGCQNTDQVDITVTSLPTSSLTPSGSLTFCDGASVDLTSTLSNSYLWNNGNTSQTITATVSGSYFVTVTDVNGCSANSDTLNVTVNALPIVDAGIDQTVCEGSSVTLTGSGTTTLNWDNSVLDGTPFTQALGTTVYTLTGTDANGCQNTDQVVVDVTSLPIIDAGVDQTVCDTNAITLSGSGATTLNWNNSIVDGVPFVPLVGTTTYILTGIDGNGCQNTDTVNVTLNPITSPTLSPNGPLTFCDGGSVDLTSTSADFYIWSNGSTQQTVSITIGGNYYVTVVNASGCTANSDTLNVVVNSLPIVDAGADQTICEGTNVTLTGNGATTLSWDNGIIDGSPFLPIAGLTTFTLTGTDANGCQNTDQVDVLVNVPIIPVISANGPLTFCNGGNVQLTASLSNDYLWTGGQTTQSITVNSSGLYQVSATDINGCVGTSSSLNVVVLPVPTVFTTTTHEVCQGENLILNASSTAPTINWYNQSVGGIVIGTGFEFQTGLLSNSTTFYVEAFQDGCYSNRETISITVNALPNVNMTSTGTSCQANDGIATASISGGTSPYSFYWNNGEQSSLSISNLSAGLYFINVEDAKGCKSIGSVEVLPSGVSITPTLVNPACFGENTGSIQINVQGLSGNLNYLWSTGGNTSSITNLFAGAYDVTVTGDNGCVATGNFILTQPNQLQNAATVILSTCGNSDGSVSLVTSGGTGAYTYLWDDGSTTSTNNTLTAGIYEVSTTDANNCFITETFFISDSNAPIVTGEISEVACNQNNGAIDLTILPIGGDVVNSILWSNGATTEDLSNLASGNYTSIITTANNCVQANGWNVTPARPLTQEICLVSVDSVTTTNLVVWEKLQTADISHYNIYRESNQIGNYQLIDTVNYNSLSVFNDVVASPKVRSWRYKISAVDECGTESLLSSHHKTVHLTLTDLGASGTKISWDKYEGNLSFSNYLLYRYTDQNDWQLIATLPSTVINYTDNTLISTAGLDYMIEVAIDEMCTATQWRAQDFDVSRSNKNKGIFNPGVGVEGYSNNASIEVLTENVNLICYPNPFDAQITIENNSKISLEMCIKDLNGKIIEEFNLNQGKNTLSTFQLESGVYFITKKYDYEFKPIKVVKY